MKLVAIFLVFFSVTASVGQTSSSVVTIREELFYTDFDMDKCLSFYNKLTDLNRASPTIMAYEAAAKALIARYSWNPITKISSIKEALNLLESALKLDKVNPEIRFLRLYIENSLPRYLGMKKHIEGDKKTILSNLSSLEASDLNTDIVDYIKVYMTSSVSCTAEEISLIKASIF